MLRRQCNVGMDKGGGGPPRARDVLLLVEWPGATSSVLATSSDAIVTSSLWMF